jgi:Cu+-exporting ATPase
MPETTLLIAGLHCGGCVGRVERALTTAPGVTQAKVNLATKRARVTFTRPATPERLAQAVTDAGYPAQVGNDPISPAQLAANIRGLRRDFLLALALTLPVFGMEMGGHVVPAIHDWVHARIGMQNAWLVQFVLTSLVLAIPGQRFFRIGVPALIKRRPEMNSLVALGAFAAWAYSSVVLFAPGLLPNEARHVYFESAAVIVTLILLGRWLEAQASGKTQNAIQALMDLRPLTALKVNDNGDQEVRAETLRPGDLIRLKPGMRVAADGVIQDGTGAVDEAMLTGEAMPVTRGPRDVITGGTVNTNGHLLVRVTAVGAASRLGQILRLVEDAQAEKLPVQAMVDKVTGWFVPVVLGLAVLTLALWLGLGAPVNMALVAAVSVLIVACPCAMGLATPTSILVATGRAANQGVLLRRPSAFEQLAQVRAVALDKTGTLTTGAPVLTDFYSADGLEKHQALPLLAALEAASEHPLAAAFMDATHGALPAVSDFESTPGGGVEGLVSSTKIAIGSGDFMAEKGHDIQQFAASSLALRQQGKTVFYGAVEGKMILLAVADPVREEAAQALADLRADGVYLAMLTGDAQATAQAVGHGLALDGIHAEMIPENKANALKNMREIRFPLAFVGDGVNDAPALAQADVGIAMGGGTDVALSTADIVLMHNDLNAVLRARRLAKATIRNIKQNLIWAFGYNVLLIPVAMGVLYPAFGVLLSPMLAAGAMALSSVFVVTNALRLRRA